MPALGKILAREILMGRQNEFPLDETLERNLVNLLAALNKVRQAYGRPMVVSSGYRPGHYNVQAGGAKNSAHLYCMACDFADHYGELAKWCINNLRFLKECGLWMENPKQTPGWVHLQTRPVGKEVIFNK